MYKVLNQNNSTEVMLYSLIEGGFTANRVIAILNDIPPEQQIILRINSDGGETFEAIALYNYLKDRNVNVVIDGICASAATIVAMAGKHITMKRGSMFMIHNLYTYTYGDAEEMKAAAEFLEKVTENVIAIYQSRSKLSAEEIRDLMNQETWLTPELAQQYGFIDDFEMLSTPGASDAGYDTGVKKERERLQALDALYTPGRAAIINRAKYQTFQSAQEIAIELLNAEAHNSAPAVNGISLPANQREIDAMNAFTEAISRKRGF